MKISVKEQILLQNPWLTDSTCYKEIIPTHYLARSIESRLLEPEWDDFCLLLLGPRSSGKTTLGKWICHQLIQTQRFSGLLYLNCDFPEIREWLASPLFIKEALETFQLAKPIIFIDEVQRLNEPGLLLKAVFDLKLKIKLMASGSSQLELRSKVKEPLTGRNISNLILPLNIQEGVINLEERSLFGCYPKVTTSQHKQEILKQLYDDYINKDIISILKVNQPDAFQKLLVLLAHCQGGMVNYNQLATDCGVPVYRIKEYLTILEETYVIKKVTPFVGNKKTEITTNPEYYFIDNGFCNYALNNFNSLESRVDRGFLREAFVFQEIFKFISRQSSEVSIHYWRTKSKAEVDFVVKKSDKDFMPIEVKSEHMRRPTITRSFRAFLEKYNPTEAVIINEDFIETTTVGLTKVHFIPFSNLTNLINLIKEHFYAGQMIW